MPLIFPSSPNLYDSYSYSGKTWIWDGSKWVTVAVGSFSTKAYISATAPNNPVDGQVWFDTTTNFLKTYSSSTWRTAGNGLISVSSSAPSSPPNGTPWLDAESGDLYVYIDGQWLGVTGSPTTQASVTASAPNNPLLGQLWFDVPNQTLKVWNGTLWVSSLGGVATAQITGTAPGNPLVGQAWFDTGSNQLKIYNGTSWSNATTVSPTVTTGRAWALTSVFGG